MSLQGSPIDPAPLRKKLGERREQLLGTRPDLALIADMISDGARVLDVGCGDGSLLELLTEKLGIDARGMEISQSGVNACVARGLSVVQGDADTDLVDYPTGAFDYVILSQTIQATRNPKEVLAQMLRIGRKAIVSFPNFGHWRVRVRLAFDGRMPRTRVLDQSWYDTPNIHLCTIRDFTELVGELGYSLQEAWHMQALKRPQAKPIAFKPGSPAANLFGEQAIFLISNRG